jgi:hypothetical protein
VMCCECAWRRSPTLWKRSRCLVVPRKCGNYYYVSGREEQLLAAGFANAL